MLCIENLNYTSLITHDVDVVVVFFLGWGLLHMWQVELRLFFTLGQVVEFLFLRFIVTVVFKFILSDKHYRN